MQPLGTKINHATSQDKKILQPLGTKKNHSTSRDKQITQPLGTKEITQLFGTYKITNL